MRWPVEEMGRYSVTPSTIPRMTACVMVSESDMRSGNESLEDAQTAEEPVSPVRMRVISSMGRMKIFPSPIFPVHAESHMAVTTSWTWDSSTRLSIFVFGTKSVLYSLPR
jgi:hypothetical protein